MSASETTRIASAHVPRKEGADKLMGCARYGNDFECNVVWHGATVRSSISCGPICSIGFRRLMDWTEFAAVRVPKRCSTFSGAV